MSFTMGLGAMGLIGLLPMLGCAANGTDTQTLALEDPYSSLRDPYTRTQSVVVSDAVIGYVNLQIDSGVHAIQLFDSWIGCLSQGDYARYVSSHMGRLMKAIMGRVPVIYFGTGNAHLVDAMFAVGPDILALDWRTPLRTTWERLGSDAVQGNMDPIVLCSDRAAIARHAQGVLDEADGKPGHIFNLGHGIVPDTPVDNVKYLVDYVHKHSAR